MKAKQQCQQLEAIDRNDPRYILGAQAAAAGVALDMRMGHLHAVGWLEEKFREQPPSLRRH